MDRRTHDGQRENIIPATNLWWGITSVTYHADTKTSNTINALSTRFLFDPGCDDMGKKSIVYGYEIWIENSIIRVK